MKRHPSSRPHLNIKKRKRAGLESLVSTFFGILLCDVAATSVLLSEINGGFSVEKRFTFALTRRRNLIFKIYVV